MITGLVVAPVEAALLRPLEVSSESRTFFFMRSSRVSRWCTCTVITVSRFLRSFFPSVRRVGDDDHLLQERVRFLTACCIAGLSFLAIGERALHVARPEELDAQQRDLRRVLEDERLQILLVHGRVRHA